ncbi:MAG: helix-turn-helix transcriptional regulator [Butyrivibrio sp.]|jgi:transcriptional regulator with XRE-family HTH domain|nr:helix-turn-helix transcriptional regulator [Butyrivibrio sp.]
MDNANEVVDRICKLCNDKNMTTYQLSKASELPETTVYNMMQRKSIPTLPILFSICKGLEITPAQFFMEDQIVELSESEREIIQIYRTLNVLQRDRVAAYFQSIKDMLPTDGKKK